MITLELTNPETGEKAVFERPDTTLEEMGAYYTFKNELTEKSMLGEMTDNEAIDKQLDYVVKLFNKKSLTAKRMKKEILSKDFYKKLRGVYRQIDPENVISEEDLVEGKQ
ncbi:hypothetical protein FHK07_11940 [Listeria monocytogenes]|nr:hypothetical protein [Listeria monocytogenes]EJM6842184.1 hypothetical protein [Listeria monocytogenes]